jgi:hypothetical protein
VVDLLARHTAAPVRLHAGGGVGEPLVPATHGSPALAGLHAGGGGMVVTAQHVARTILILVAVVRMPTTWHHLASVSVALDLDSTATPAPTK